MNIKSLVSRWLSVLEHTSQSTLCILHSLLSSRLKPLHPFEFFLQSCDIFVLFSMALCTDYNVGHISLIDMNFVIHFLT